MSEAPQTRREAAVRRAWLRVLVADIRAYAAKCDALAAEQTAEQMQRKEKNPWRSFRSSPTSRISIR